MSPGMAVDLALVLAVDCSSSVDAGDFRLQMDGIAAALRHPPLAAAIAAGPRGRIALALAHWSTAESQAIAVPWHSIADRADLERIAQQVERTQRRSKPGGTGLAAAMQFSAGLLDALPVWAARRVIDISGDGEDNEGGDPAGARDRVVALGVTINGLPILHGGSRLEAYYREQVIGGPGSFVVPAYNVLAFRDAMTRKLLREVMGQRVI